MGWNHIDWSVLTSVSLPSQWPVSFGFHAQHIAVGFLYLFTSPRGTRLYSAPRRPDLWVATSPRSLLLTFNSRVCYFGLISTAHAPSTEADSSGPEMQVTEPHGPGLVFRKYTRPSSPPGPLRCVLPPSLASLSLSLAGKQFVAVVGGII